MKRKLTLGGASLLLSLAIISCNLQQPTAPTSIEHPVTIQISGLNSVIQPDNGFVCAEAFDVTVFDSAAMPIASYPVQSWVEAGPGYVYSLHNQTDSSGVIRQLYFCKAPVIDRVLTLCVASGGDTVRMNRLVKSGIVR